MSAAATSNGQSQEQGEEPIALFLQLAINTRETLTALFIPFIANGSLFVPCASLPRLRQQVLLFIKLEFLNEEFVLVGRVGLLVPHRRGVKGMRQKGFALQFEHGAEALLEHIENSLQYDQ